MSALRAIVRYPIKGLAGESVSDVELTVDATIPGDRVHALQFSDRTPPDASQWRPKKYFLQSASSNIPQHIEIEWHANMVVFRVGASEICVTRTLDGFESLPMWLGDQFPELPPLTLASYAHGFTDEPTAYVSIINNATVSAIADTTHTPNHPARFRGNLMVEGLNPFAELEWIGQELMIGTARFEVVEPIVRCPATQCSWMGSREYDFLDRLDAAFHTDCCGLFTRVIKAGRIKQGDAIEVVTNT